MNTTTPQYTPETGEGSPSLANFTIQRLKRERDEARDQLQAMREAIREVFNSFADEDSAWLLDDLQTAALTKLKPFIKP
jgi:hypothetical protein